MKPFLQHVFFIRGGGEFLRLSENMHFQVHDVDIFLSDMYKLSMGI